MAEVTLDVRCGSYAGYKAHYNANEQSCQLCIEARRKYWRDRKNANRELYSTQQKNWKENNPEKYAEMHRSKSRSRRAKIRHNGFEKYSESELLALYGVNCHLCNLAIDFNAPRRQGIVGWEYGFQVDHIIPIALGGADCLENVRPAHGICNIRKGCKYE